MITQGERRRLVAPYMNEPVYIAGTLLKCAACLLVIGGLAIIGGAGEPAERPALQAQPSNQDSAGAAERLLPETRASANQPASAPVISPGPTNVADVRPVVFGGVCAADC